MKQVLLFFAALLLIVTACSNSPSVQSVAKSNPAFDLAAAKKAVEEGQQTFMNLFKKGDSVGVANLYTVDAKVMNAGRPAVEGRDSIVHFFGSIFKPEPKIITVKTLGVWHTEDMIVEDGKWIMADKTGKEYDHGKYLIFWKMEDGKWKKFRDCHNSDIYPLAK